MAVPPLDSLQSRNSPCPCGSGRRYKECHGRLVVGTAAVDATDRALQAMLADALAHQQAGRTADAETLYRAVLESSARAFDALHMLGVLRHQAGDHDAAIVLLRRAIDVNPTHAPAHSNLALALGATHAHAEALASVDRALALVPGYFEALNNRGLLLQAQLRHSEALQCFDAALSRAPDHPEILSNRGNTLLELRRHAEAAQCFARLVEVAPDHPWALGYLYLARMLCCDWTSVDALVARIDTAVHEGRRAIAPFVYLAASASPADHRRAAEIQAREYVSAPLPAPSGGLRYGHDRIRIAYLSADFRDHPASHLAAHLFETHDRTRFEVTAISVGPDTGDPMRRRLERAFDRFIDVRGRSDGDIAALIREREIDVAIDLMGYTNDGRPGILARRPAPVQVNFLGYAGTQGRAAIDYFLADGYVIPTGDDKHYAERVVRLPDNYFVHDPTRAIAVPAGRAESGLPARAFVFCCFNNTYKITPATFDVWMRLLVQVDGSVLWLLASDADARRNLKREAAGRGVDPARLVFAGRAPIDAHLGRHRLADLFLDTHHYNAHTTALDALWAGLPVLTYAGTALVGRVAAGMLHSIGLPELVARDRADYEARALELARSPSMLSDVRAKLAQNRTTFPLFDALRFRTAIEGAYIAMWARNEAGLRPAGIDVAPDGTATVTG